MGAYVVRRFLLMLLTLFGISVIIFVLLRVMPGNIVDILYDADAIYVHLTDKPYAFGEDLDAERRVDYADDRSPIGVELTCVSHGVDLSGLPVRDEIARLLEQLRIKVLA